MIAIYNPPASCNTPASTLALLTWLTNTLRNHSTANAIVLGDMNMPDIEWDIMHCTKESPAANEHKVIEICDIYNLTQHNRQPSRSNSTNILDLVLSTPEHIVQDVI